MDTNPNLKKATEPEFKGNHATYVGPDGTLTEPNAGPAPIRDEKEPPRTIQGTATPTIKKG